jgi:hypothetical protein
MENIGMGERSAPRQGEARAQVQKPNHKQYLRFKLNKLITARFLLTTRH